MSSPEPPALVPPQLIERCLALLAERPAGLVSDIDGTLSDIAATPEVATVNDEIRQSLARLARRLDLVAIVTGRAAPIASAMIDLPELIYLGNHGMEQLDGAGLRQNPDAAAAITAIAAAVEEVEAAFAATYSDWLLVENKGVSASVHYRLAPDPVAARALLLPVISATAARHGLVVTEGRLIFELRPDVAINKGSALADLAVRHRLRSLIFLGDDLTDVDAFLALQELRAAGTLDGLAIGALGSESHPRVRETMDLGIPGVPAVAALLEALSERLDPIPAEPGAGGQP